MTSGVNELTAGNSPHDGVGSGSVAASVGRGLVDFAASLGAQRELLLERAGMVCNELEDPDGRIPLERYAALMRAARELCNAPAFALKFGESVDLAELSFIGSLCYAAESLDDAFVQMNRYARLMIDVPVDGGGERFERLSNHRSTWLIDRRTNPNAFPELTEATFARMGGRARSLAHESFVKEVHVTHTDPGYRDEFERVFQAPVFFSSDRNAMLIDDSLISPSVLRSSRDTLRILSARADTLLDELDEATTTRARVEALLIPILHRGDASMERIAVTLGISRQTLYRRLRAEGVRFDEVLDQLRHRMALSYLEEQKMSASETAYLVGFSEPSAFSRAFKRWTGHSPGRWPGNG
jgi:AraC-like DNA-binding protein